MSGQGRVAIVDYGAGNLLSVRHAVERCGWDAELVTEPSGIERAERLILPGVGAFPAAMRRLTDSGLDVALRSFAASGRPLLGICLGMQLLADTGEEFGEHPGLGIISGRVMRIPERDDRGDRLRVPFVGWTAVEAGPADAAGAEVLRQMPHLYFVHSFGFVPTSDDDVLATYRRGGGRVVAAVARQNVVGVQFHPERSGQDGLRFLASFLRARRA